MPTTKYKVTYLLNSDYCQIKPDDTECQRTVIIDAESKTQAVMELHRDRGMQRQIGSKSTPARILPEIWSVERV